MALADGTATVNPPKADSGRGSARPGWSLKAAPVRREQIAARDNANADRDRHAARGGRAGDGQPFLYLHALTPAPMPLPGRRGEFEINGRN